jgi:hypothetical protein
MRLELLVGCQRHSQHEHEPPSFETTTLTKDPHHSQDERSASTANLQTVSNTDTLPRGHDKREPQRQAELRNLLTCGIISPKITMPIWEEHNRAVSCRLSQCDGG